MELLGPEGEAAYVDLDGWETALGAFFRVNVNGNHRAAAFAILGAPCIPATVQWNLGPYSTSSSTDTEADEVLCSYRALLHCFESRPIRTPRISCGMPTRSAPIGPSSSTRRNPPSARYQSWNRSLGIGMTIQSDGCRELFDDVEALLAAGRRTRKVLDRTRRGIGTRGIRSLLRSVGLTH